jgi:hypothetical protein
MASGEFECTRENVLVYKKRSTIGFNGDGPGAVFL